MAMTNQLAAPPGAPARFLGFTRPTTTPIPDQVIDELLPQLTGAELKVVLYICRRTLGFQKISDNISLQQLLSGLVKKNGDRLDYGTGLSKTTLLKTLRDLQAKGIIETTHRSSSERGDEATNYRLCFVEGVVPLVCQRRRPELQPVETVGWRRPDFTPRGQENAPGGRSKNLTTGEVQKSRPQQTEVQETESQETAARAITEVPNNTSDGPPVFGGGALDTELSFWLETEQTNNIQAQSEVDTDCSFVITTPPPTSGAPPARSAELTSKPTGARWQSGASALIAIGMTAKVAERLAERYSLERIEEKLGYLDFLQQHQPAKVKNPCGWLRTAIEDDFAAPDGFVSPEAVAQHAAEYERLTQEAQARTQEDERACQQAHEAQARQQQAYRAQLTIAYGTTEADQRLWHSAQQDMNALGRPALYALIADAEILQCTEDTALIGVVSDAQLKHLSHPGTQKAIQRSLSFAAGRTLTPQFVRLPAVGEVCPLIP